MNTHPWIGLGATVSRHDLPATHGIIVTVAVDWLGMMSDDGVFVNGAFHSLTFDNPAEARRRIEAVGAPTLTVQAEPAPVDHEAMGRGFAHALLTHDGAHFLDRYKVVAMMGEAIGKGIVLGALAYMYDRGTVHQRVLEVLGSAIGKGIDSARGGAS